MEDFVINKNWDWFETRQYFKKYYKLKYNKDIDFRVAGNFQILTKLKKMWLKNKKH